jgi:hypothetical protein
MIVKLWTSKDGINFINIRKHLSEYFIHSLLERRNKIKEKRNGILFFYSNALYTLFSLSAEIS